MPGTIPDVKEKAERCIEKMKTFPPEYRNEIPDIIDSLALRPCVRKRGLGTAFPFAEGWIIEALSDSTIYMAFFIVAKYLNAGMIEEDQLTDGFFDFVFLGTGSAKDASEKTGVSEELLGTVREEFD